MELFDENATICVVCKRADIEVWDMCKNCWYSEQKRDQLPDLDDDPFGFNEDRAKFEALLGDIEIDL